MELTATRGTVESIAPIHTNQAYHGHEQPHTHTSRIIHLERLELGEIAPAVATFEESKDPDGGAAAFHDGLAKFDGKAVEDRTAVVGGQRVGHIAHRSLGTREPPPRQIGVQVRQIGDQRVKDREDRAAPAAERVEPLDLRNDPRSGGAGLKVVERVRDDEERGPRGDLLFGEVDRRGYCRAVRSRSRRARA